MFTNARLYNAPDTPYFKSSTKCENFFEQRVAASLSWLKKGPLAI